MPRLAKPKARAIIMHALSKFCSKQADRRQLEGGDQYDVDLAISGTIGNQKIEDACRGSLTVGHDTTKNSSSAIAPAKLVAYLVNVDPKNAKKRVEQLRQLAEAGNLGEKITADQEAQAASLIKLFNQTEPKTAKGSVSFAAAKAAA
ncbi:hypothetical protein AB1K70_26560 [Bremerella sp. JC770]|uniref:hypothetical protein n=1 Tax=Bremerella sp. JC770 TaxID=3232137 RepID=UPI003458A94E